jgi:putative transcriptional regulator
MKFETLEAICAFLGCQPGDILEYAPEATPDVVGESVKRAG